MNKNKSGEYRGKGGWSVRKQMCYNLKKNCERKTELY